MVKTTRARRYARAAFEIALESKELERWQADLQQVAGALADTEFLAALETPKIRFEVKTRLIAERLGGIGPQVANLVCLLAQRNEARIIGAIEAEYRRLVDVYHGVQKAEVVTAVPIDDEDERKLAADLGALVNSKIVVKPRVDPEILGGAIARIDGKLLDGSTRSKLEALKRQLER
jgi:F-type H+-transporting ATPase subunit delta